MAQTRLHDYSSEKFSSYHKNFIAKMHSSYEIIYVLKKYLKFKTLRLSFMLIRRTIEISYNVYVHELIVSPLTFQSNRNCRRKISRNYIFSFQKFHFMAKCSFGMEKNRILPRLKFPELSRVLKIKMRHSKLRMNSLLKKFHTKSVFIWGFYKVYFENCFEKSHFQVLYRNKIYFIIVKSLNFGENLKNFGGKKKIWGVKKSTHSVSYFYLPHKIIWNAIVKVTNINILLSAK